MKVRHMAVTTADDGEVRLELKTVEGANAAFDFGGVDAAALGHSLIVASPYGETDILRMRQTVDTLTRALEILGA